jgi:nucleotide-binding universal stress UspA family protein
VLAHGTPASVLISEASKVDLAVVGRRGAGHLTHLLVGSVADQLLHHSPCTTVIVPEP